MQQTCAPTPVRPRPPLRPPNTHPTPYATPPPQSDFTPFRVTVTATNRTFSCAAATRDFGYSPQVGRPSWPRHLDCNWPAHHTGQHSVDALWHASRL